MLKSILCPVDFSEHSERALHYALKLAAMQGAHVTLLTVTDPLLDAAASAAGSRETMRRQTQEELKALFDKVVDDEGAPPRLSVAVSVGPVADEILKQAAESGADLIVMGTQGMGAAERIMLGSTTEKILRLSRVPVLAVPPGPTG